MIRIPILTPTSPLEEQHTRNLIEGLTVTIVGPLLMTIGAGIMMKLAPSSGVALVLSTMLGTYVGALASKMMLPRVYTQSVLVMTAGFWASVLLGIFVYFAGFKVTGHLDVPTEFRTYARAFAAPVAVVIALMVNMKVARKDYGFSGPINWLTTGFGLLLLVLAVGTSWNFEKVGNHHNHHGCFHHAQPTVNTVKF